MFIIKEPSMWERFCELYKLGSSESTYEYSMEEVIEVIKIIRRVETVNSSATVCREFFEMYIDAFQNRLDGVKGVSPLFYLRHGGTELSYSQLNEFRNTLGAILQRFWKEEKMMNVHPLTIWPAGSRVELKYLMSVIFVGTSLYGLDDRAGV